MTIYNGTIVPYQSFREYIGTAINLSTDTLKMLLTTSSYTPSASSHTVLADITNECSGNGYARATLGSVSWSHSGATATFDFADPTFTASGGSIVARYWAIYDDTPTSPADPLVAYGLLDSTPADVTITSGNTFTFQINASGLFTLT